MVCQRNDTAQDIRPGLFFVFFSQLSAYRVLASGRAGHGASCGMLVLHEVSNSDMAVCVSVIGKEVIQLSGLFFAAG